VRVTSAFKRLLDLSGVHVTGVAFTPTNALDTVRRQIWQELRKLPDQQVARRFKGARWVLLKNPTDLTDDQAATLRRIKRRGGELWRAYALKEALREVFSGDLSEAEVVMMLDRFCSKASRSGLKPFVTVAQAIRKRRTGIGVYQGSWTCCLLARGWGYVPEETEVFITV